ncbi:MAG TPA: hypothetical protein VIO11_06150, partial [Candidatus Methanoperedens sp.]
FHIILQTDNCLKAPGALIRSYLPTLHAVRAVSKAVILETETKHLAQSIPRFGISERLYPTASFEFFRSIIVLRSCNLPRILDILLGYISL